MKHTKIIDNSQGFGVGFESPGFKKWDEEIASAKNAKKSRLTETSPLIEKEGFLGMDDIDRMRRGGTWIN